MSKYLDSNGLLYFWQKIKNLFVAKIEGKGLSTNDYTTAEKNKLAGLTQITIDSALSSTSINPVQNKIINAALDNKVSTAKLGQASGVATLGTDGLVPSTQLPSYVDDVVEGYYYNNAFYVESAHTTLISGETGKIYVDLATNLSYRYGGSTYVLITSADMTAITNAEIDVVVAT